MQTKFALVLCLDPEDETWLLNKEDVMHVVRRIDFGTNSEHPSLAVIFEVFPDDMMEFTAEVRERGMKVGIYSAFEKASGFANRAFGVGEDGTLEEVNLDFGGGETCSSTSHT